MKKLNTRIATLTLILLVSGSDPWPKRGFGLPKAQLRQPFREPSTAVIHAPTF